MRGNSEPHEPPEIPEGTINVSDPDSRMMRRQGTPPPRQAYNAQTRISDRPDHPRRGVTVDATDFGHVGPSITLQQLQRHGVSKVPAAVIADAGYWNTRQIRAVADRGTRC